MDNIKVISRQSDVSQFYNQASIVMNLSDPRQFVETFGLTALEAMFAGLPVIVPPVGGISEMVEDGVNGYKMDVRNLSAIAERISDILSNREAYVSLSGGALAMAGRFDEEEMVERVCEVLLS